jgi:hypothetical protein
VVEIILALFVRQLGVVPVVSASCVRFSRFFALRIMYHFFGLVITIYHCVNPKALRVVFRDCSVCVIGFEVVGYFCMRT